jgi:DNA-binding CsgD family transcriptional regulator
MSQALKLEDYIYATNEAENPEELFRLFLEQLEALGLDRVVYSFMTDSPVFKRKAEHGVVRNYPEDWMKHYTENKYITYDPVYRTALFSRKPFTWNEIIEKQDLDPVQKKVMWEAREAGLKDGVALSIQSPLGGIVGVGLASSSGGVDLSKNAMSQISMIVHQFHLCHSDFLAKEHCISQEIITPLTEQEREILIWCAQSKSNHDIGIIMGVTSKTIDFHLSKIYKKLGVNGRILAVVKACNLGLISF